MWMENARNVNYENTSLRCSFVHTNNILLGNVNCILQYWNSVWMEKIGTQRVRGKSLLNLQKVLCNYMDNVPYNSLHYTIIVSCTKTNNRNAMDCTDEHSDFQLSFPTRRFIHFHENANR